MSIEEEREYAFGLVEPILQHAKQLEARSIECAEKLDFLRAADARAEMRGRLMGHQMALDAVMKAVFREPVG